MRYVMELPVKPAAGSLLDPHHEYRLADFEKRTHFSPSSVYTHVNHGWRYVPVHHFADETPDSVPWADSWVQLAGDAALLECIRVSAGDPHSGLYARIDEDAPFWPKLHAHIPEALTREVVERAMVRFVELGFPDDLRKRLIIGGPKVRLSPWSA